MTLKFLLEVVNSQMNVFTSLDMSKTSKIWFNRHMRLSTLHILGQDASLRRLIGL